MTKFRYNFRNLRDAFILVIICSTSFQTTLLPPRSLKGSMGFLNLVLLEFRMDIQITEELYNISITSQMPKLCMCLAYLFEKIRYQANTNSVSNYNSFHHMDLLFICVKFGIIVPSIFGFNHILIQRNKRINLVTFVAVIRTTNIHG